MKRHIRKCCLVLACVLTLTAVPTSRPQAQILILDIIKAAAKKVLLAISIRMQKLQNKTLGLQNAQKKLENSMALKNLNEINDWLKKEKELFQGYYDELKKVRAVIAGYQGVRRIVLQQQQLVNEYRAAWKLFKEKKVLTADELHFIEQVYAKMLEASLHNLEELGIAITSVSTQMNDAQRLEVIHRIALQMEQNLSDLRRFDDGIWRVVLGREGQQNNQKDIRDMYQLEQTTP